MTERRVLRRPAEFADRHRRFLRSLVARAVGHGNWHARADDWLDRCITEGDARAVLEDERILGFFAVRPARDVVLGDVVYGSACAWRKGAPWIEAVVHEALIAEAHRLGTTMFGGYFPDNADAVSFYSAARGWQEVTRDAFPDAFHADIAELTESIVLVRRPL